jgi:hypothetical protein
MDSVEEDDLKMRQHPKRIVYGKLRLTLGAKNSRKVGVENQFDSKRKRKVGRGGRKKTKGWDNWDV